jgi:hypothetical protein
MPRRRPPEPRIRVARPAAPITPVIPRTNGALAGNGDHQWLALRPGRLQVALPG